LDNNKSGENLLKNPLPFESNKQFTIIIYSLTKEGGVPKIQNKLNINPEFG
jgi:hypothetical protein